MASLVGAGFTDDEAACIFGEIDFASAPSLEDPAVISAIFDTCDISLERLAEIESVVPEAGSGEVGDDPLAGGGDEAFAEVFVAALVVALIAMVFAPFIAQYALPVLLGWSI